MDTITVRRANVILKVAAEQRQEYLNKGFDVIDASGAVIEATVPADVNVLRRAYVEHKAKIKELEAEIAKLKEEKAKPAPKKTTTKSTDKK